MARHDIIVVGASAGGVEALVGLVSSLPADLPATIFLVLHIPAQSPSLLPEILNRAGKLSAVHPSDGEAIQPGRIYIAPPDQHLLVEEDRVRIVRGPKENRHRPAIDPLFRSAARVHGTRVVGVVLTGSLDDGTAGLLAIKKRGGTAIVQDPHDALYSSMPRSALAHVDVDYVLPLSKIGPLLVRLAKEEAAEGGKEWLVGRFEERLRESEQHATLIWQVLLKGRTNIMLTTNANIEGVQENENIVITSDTPQAR